MVKVQTRVLAKMMKQASKKEKKPFCTMTSFYDQNPSGSCYLVQIRAFDLPGMPNSKKYIYERKKKTTTTTKGFWS